MGITIYIIIALIGTFVWSFVVRWQEINRTPLDGCQIFFFWLMFGPLWPLGVIVMLFSMSIAGLFWLFICLPEYLAEKLNRKD